MRWVQYVLSVTLCPSDPTNTMPTQTFVTCINKNGVIPDTIDSVMVKLERLRKAIRKAKLEEYAVCGFKIEKIP